MTDSQSISLPDFTGVRVLVAGDAMLDRYLWGEVSRISPEAPVPVVRVLRSTVSLGGACNVAANLAGLGAGAVVLSACGEDESGRLLAERLKAAGITARLAGSAGRPTTTKTRVMGASQQLLRLDEEAAGSFGPELEGSLLALFEAELAGLHAVILSDYGKGLFAGDLAPAMIEHCRAANLPVFVDPKGLDFERYRGATCVTPNEAEFRAVAGGPVRDEAELAERAYGLVDRFDISALLVTRGARGMSLFSAGAEPVHIPTQAMEVFDVSGAGDTVIATLAAGVAAGFDLAAAARLANVAAGIAVGKLGTQPVTRFELSEVLRRRQIGPAHKVRPLAEARAAVNAWRAKGERVVFTNGCFDLLHVGHVKLLHEAARLGDKLVVGLNSDASVIRLKGPERPIIPEAERAALLAALECVDLVVIFTEDTPRALISALLPDVLVKGGDYSRETVVGHELVEAAGGRVALIPLEAGKSTSNLIAKLKAGLPAEK